MRLKSCLGEIELRVVHGQEPADGTWICPIRQWWGLDSHQAMTPALEERICYGAVETLSYERAANMARKWGVEVDDATIYRHAQKAGTVARAREAGRVERVLDLKTRPGEVARAKRSAPRGKFTMILMMDGWMNRERGEDWGLKPSETPGERVAWHEVKAGIVFRLDQRARTQSGRPVILEKFQVACRDSPEELGRRLYAEALRRGLHQAERVLVVADGAVWIWNLVQDRFPEAAQMLDFYHASQHLWAVAHELHGQGKPEAKAWVEPLLHQLRHGGEAGVIQTLDDLFEACRSNQEASGRAEAIERERNYFRKNQGRIGYREAADKGLPIGSGAMESTCAQAQRRFKGLGKFWSLPAEKNLMALQIALNNDDWDEIWEPNYQHN